jgi:uncharacterized membrane protein YdjX (TVP38/TMEM64 family)
MYSEILDKPIYLFMISMVIFPIISYYFFKHKNIQKYLFGLITYLKYMGNKSVKGQIYYILIVVIMNIVFMNSTIPNLMSGYIFGFKKGTLLTLIGCIISGVISFYTSRYILKDKILEEVEQQPVLSEIKKDEKLLTTYDWFELTILSRLPPTYPYHLTSYFWGITDIHVLIFTIGSLIGILPGLSLETYIGYKLTNIKDIFKSKHNIFITIGGIVITIIISLMIGLKAEEILKNKTSVSK